MSKTHFKKAFNTPYLGSHDLPDYKDIDLTIEKVELKMSKGLKENSNFNIVYFKEKVKPMLMNATNCKTLKFLSGSPYIEDWKGLRITVYVQEKVRAFGQEHDALRIRDYSPSKPILNDKHPQWISIVEKVKEGKVEKSVIEKHYGISNDNWKKLLSQAKKQ